MKLLKEEKHLNKEVYNVLRNMGVSDNEAQTIATEAARYDKRFDSLERSIFAIQTGLRNEMRDANQALRTEMKDAIAMSEKNMTKAISELKTEMSELKTEIKTTAVEMKTDMLWVKRLSIASFVTLLGVLLASALAVLININI